MKRFVRVLAIVLVWIAFFMLYLLSGTSGRETRIEYTVDARDPVSDVLHVTMEIQPPVRPFLTLWLRDVDHEGVQRVENLSVRRNGRPVSNWQTLPSFEDARNVWTGFSREPIEISYDVKPHWMKGQAPRSYLGPDFGYLRGMIVLYTPITYESISGMLNNIDALDDPAGQAGVEFILPKGWTLISAWGSAKLDMPIAHLRNTYFGIGPMSIATAQVGDNTLLLGVYDGFEEEQIDQFLQDIPHLFETMRQRTGISPESVTPYWALTILPSEPIHGGASGLGSLVTSDEISTISHEMFHWWNGDVVQTTPDANWIHEGFTEYYEGKMLYAAGIWSSAELNEHLDKLHNRMGLEFVIDGRWIPVDLVQASEDLASRGANEEYYKVYNGGALVADFLDRELQAEGKSLDEIWIRLDAVQGPVTTEIFLQELAALNGTKLAKDCKDLVYGRRAIP